MTKNHPIAGLNKIFPNIPKLQLSFGDNNLSEI
jgi:hypothetical protein